MSSLTIKEEDKAKLALVLRYRWSLHARKDQLEPDGDWSYWMMLAGRGSGKTRAGAETLINRAYRKQFRWGHAIAPTAADIRKTMVEGPAGILASSPPWFYPRWEASKKKMTFPNGVVVYFFSGDEPDRLRGPQCEFLWADELAAWRYEESWDMAMFGLRLGNHPQAVITSTPRPIPVIKNLINNKACVVTRATTYDNRKNLAGSFYDVIITKYEGSRLGRQELLAEVLDDNPYALWKRGWIDDNRISKSTKDFDYIVVAVDPAATSGEDSCETGIVVVGLDASQDPPHFVVLEDATVDKATPKEWGTAAVTAYHKYNADYIIAESNNGGEMIANTISNIDEDIPVELVHASRGKRTRAEPVSALYEQGRVHHLGSFPDLEDQMCEWVPGEGDSPDRMDALVWGISYLMKPPSRFSAMRG